MAFSARQFGFVSIAVLAAVFALNSWLPQLPGLRSLYVLPVLLAGLERSFRNLWALTAAAFVLLLVNTVRLLPGTAPTQIVIDALVPAGMVWLSTLLVLRYRREEEARMAARAARQSAQRALSESRQDLGNILYALDQSTIVARTTIDGTITYVNDAFCRISKYSREELIGQNHRLINSGLHPPEFFQELYRSIASGRVWRGEIRNRAKDGSIYWVDTTIVPLLGADERPYEYIAIRHEITERKRSEAALRDQTALAQLGKLAAVVAHEVRNPLAGIRGALQIIQPRLPAGEREQAVIIEAVQRIDTLNEIVEDLLMFARPTRPSLAPTSVPQLVSDTVGLFKQDPSVTGITVEVTDADVLVSADAEQVKQVLLNVLMNGAQAMEGHGHIRISVQEADHEVFVQVADRGPGISEEVRDRLFEPFFTTRHRGTGLGLSTARRLMTAQGGSIRLECPPGGGTVAVIGLQRCAPVVSASREP